MEDMNNWDGMNTAGLNAETFGSSDPFGVPQENNMDTYAATWSNEGSYTVPGYDNIEPEPMKKEGRGLEIATLVMGILSIILCCCNGFFGIIGLIMGIVAIAKGKKSGVAIAGIVCSVIGLLFAFITLVFSFTEYGQEMQEAFWEGFEQGYESTSGEDIDINYDDTDSTETAEYEESPVETHEGTTVVSDKEASKIVIEGNVLALPCQLSDIMKYYEISPYSEELVSGGLEPNATEIVYFAKGEEENGIYAVVDNDTEKTIADIKTATVHSLSIDEKVTSASIFNGISMGMSSSQIEDALQDVKYNKSEMSGYVFYNIYAGDNNRYSFSLMLEDDKIINISAYYMD